MERVAFVMHVRAGEEEEYRRRHREVWPAVLADLERAGVQSMSIFMADRKLFLYMETANYAEAVRILAESPESVRWEEYMAPIMEDESGDDYDPHDAYLKGCRRCSTGRLADGGEGRDTVSKEVKT